MELSVAIADTNALASAFVVFRGIETSIKKAASMGYDGVELALKCAEEVDRKLLAKWLVESDMKVACISTGQVFADMGLMFTDPDRQRRKKVRDVFKEIIDLAAEFGQMVNVGRVRGRIGSRPREEAERLFIEMARELCEYAGDKDVTLILEPVNRYEIDFVNSVEDCVATTMINGMKELYARQREAGFSVEFATISNCVVNMISPEHYRQRVLPFDLKIRKEFKSFGVHNCAWVVDPYMEAYATVPDLGYIDMGMTSDFEKAARLFEDSRRNVLYTSMDMADKSREQIRGDFERIARELAPCDVGLLNLGPEVGDEQVIFFMDLCEQLSCKYGPAFPR